jgi:hypothetical protein
MKRYVVTLTAEERRALQGLIAAGKGSTRKLTHARILLKADSKSARPASRRSAQRAQKPSRRTVPAAVLQHAKVQRAGRKRVTGE